MMKKTINILSIISILMLIFSCNEKTDFGYNILPDSDKVKFLETDTFTIEVTSERVDSIVTSGFYKLILGKYDDPIFGNVEASVVLQYGLIEYPNYNPIDYIGDSVLIFLPYADSLVSDGTYGNLNEQTLEVYELNSDLSYDSSYYSTQNPELLYDASSQPVGVKSYIPYQTYDSTHTAVVIKLSDDFTQRLAEFDLASFSETSHILNVFKGLYIKPINNGSDASLVNFVINSNSILRFYYHNDTRPDSCAFGVNSIDAAHFNIFNHDYTNSDIFTDTGNDSLAYIQGMQGVKVKIHFPFIENLNDIDEEIEIYRAELVVNTAPEAYTLESYYPVIDDLIITAINSDGSYVLMQEYSGTTYSSVSYENGQYRFDIAGYIDSVLKGTVENNGFYLFANKANTNFKRSVITTAKHSNKMKLILTYTKLNN